KWITGEEAREYGMRLRQGVDAIVLGVNTILADDPRLTVRRWEMGDGRWKMELNKLNRLHELPVGKSRGPQISNFQFEISKRGIVVDSRARTPLNATVVSDE